MLIHAVARVDDVRFDRLGEQPRRAAHRVADDDDVVFHRVQRLARIDERLPLLHGRGGRRNVDDVRAHVLGGKLEAAAGAGTVLVEEGGHRLALQVRELLDVLFEELFHAHAHGEDLVDLLRGQVIQPQYVLMMQHCLSL